ncbi:MAG: peptidoglycan editing factor PgeF [Rhodanobacteraceae bacterium]
MSAEWIIPDWPEPAGVRAMVTTRYGPGVSQPPFDAFNLGSRCGDTPEAVAQNRARLREALQLPAEPRWLRQVHGAGVAQFAADSADGEFEADAACTRAPGEVLAILTADCMPVLFCANDGSEIAAAHAGWRGLCAGVVENTLAAMRTPRDNVLAWLGPAIGPRSYEVGDEVRGAFVARDGAAVEAFAPTRPGHWHCDLYALARLRLGAAGVNRIYGGGFDTFTDPRLYSFRRDGARSGRFATLIWISRREAAMEVL